MNRKPTLLFAAREAVQRSAECFTPFWGETSGEGAATLFPSAPAALGVPRIGAVHTRRMMGGMFSMEITLTLNGVGDGGGLVTFRGGRGGSFSAPRHSGAAAGLAAALSGEDALLADLSHVDLESLTLALSPGETLLRLRPFGGGLVYLVFPPMRYAVAFPPEQAEPIACALGRMAAAVHSFRNQNTHT